MHSATDGSMRGRASLLLTIVLCALLAGGCSTYRLRDLAKTDINFIADAHLRMADELLAELLRKLYLRNPWQLQRAPDGTTVDQRIDALFGQTGPYQFAELGGREAADAVLLGLDPGYRGDRVFAVMAGLTSMIHKAYGYREEFFLLDELDQQSLYNSARNVEILVWRIKHRGGDNGDPLLLTNSIGDEPENLSFERLFGKLIAIQDLLASITAERKRRTISKIAHSIASSAFLP